MWDVISILEKIIAEEDERRTQELMDRVGEELVMDESLHEEDDKQKTEPKEISGDERQIP